MNRISLIALVIVLPFVAHAQKKIFTFDQIFKGRFPTIFKPLPEIGGWADDEHYIEVRTDDNDRETAISVDVKTGKTFPFIHPSIENNQPPEIEGAQNTTLSPDGKYAAYTKENNLYVTEIATKKETAITTDGKDGILNGYSSWINI